jgi:dihydrofolate reductase
MGRKTYETLPSNAKEGRTIIVLTTQASYCVQEPHIVMHTVGEVIEYAHKNNLDNLYVAGGGEMYLHFLPLAEQLYLTIVGADFDADVYFPAYGMSDWDLVSVKFSKNDEYNYGFYYYERANS